MATLGSGTIDIAVPLTIHVDSWFDADMDIAIKLPATGGDGSPVVVLSRGVSLEVSWAFLEHLPSLGCTHFVEEGMSQLGQALLADIVHSQLVPEVAKAFNDKVNEFCTNAAELDPLHRTYVLTVFDLGRRSQLQGLPAVAGVAACEQHGALLVGRHLISREARDRYHRWPILRGDDLAGAAHIGAPNVKGRERHKHAERRVVCDPRRRGRGLRRGRLREGFTGVSAGGSECGGLEMQAS